MSNLKFINRNILVLTVVFLFAGLFTANQKVFAGAPTAQGGVPCPPEGCRAQQGKPTLLGSKQKPEHSDRQLAAAQFRNQHNQPPSNGFSSGETPTRTGISYYLSIFFLLGGIWTLMILAWHRFAKSIRQNGKIVPKLLGIALKPSFALSALGFLFLAMIVTSVLTNPTGVSAEKRAKLDKSKMTGVMNAANKPVFKTSQQIGGSGITQIGSPVFDAAGNRYVRGGFTRTLTIGATTLTATNDFDLFLAKYDANGDALWARQASGATSGVPDTLAVEGATALAIDAGGNVYIGGSFVKTITLQGGANSITLNDDGAAGINYESFVAKYDVGGNLIWAKGGDSGSPKNAANLEVGQNGVDQIVFDSNGNPFVAGFVSGSRFLGESFTNYGQSDILLAKLDPANGAVVWKQIIGGTDDDNALDLKIDGTNNLYIIGNYGSESITFPNGDTFANPDDPTDMLENSTNTFIAKFDSNGDNSMVINLDNDDTLGGSNIAVNAAGEIFLTGYFFDSATFGDFTLTETEGGTDDTQASVGGYIAKMDANGDFVWAQEFGGIGESLALDGAGRVYVVGTFYDTGVFGAGTANEESLASFGGEDLFVARYETNGNFEWAKPIASTGIDGQIAIGNPDDPNSATENTYNPLGIAYNPARQTMFVSGDFQGTISLDCITLQTPGTSLQSYLAELSADNEAVNCRIWNGLDDDDNNWDSTDNWNGGITPNNNESVYIPYTGNSFDNPTYNPAAPKFFDNLTVADDRTLTLEKNFTMNGKLWLTGGIVNAGADRMIDLAEDATTNHIADLDGSGGYVIGKMRKQFGSVAPFTFTVGTANGYSPVDLNPQVAVGSLLVVNAVEQPQPLFAATTDRLNRYWTLDALGESPLVTNLTFHYLESDVAGDESLFKLYKIDFPFPPEEQTATIDTEANTATVNNVSNFSDWTLAKPIAPTAATATIGGRVMTANGRGAAQARVTLTNAAGESRFAVTNTFGYYSFAETPTGTSYVLSVVSKRYKFPQPTQVLSVTTDSGDINFIAAQ